MSKLSSVSKLFRRNLKTSFVSTNPWTQRASAILMVAAVAFVCASVSAAVTKKTVVSPRATSERFDVALIGDLGYNPTEERQLQTLLTDINRKNVDFVIHDGDIKSGSSPCTDALFQQRLALFQQSRRPFVFVPGDNEWTDCHRSGGDPLERLAKLRELFFPTNYSLGQSVLLLDRQSSDPRPEFAPYRENVRWTYGKVMFVGLHIVGSNNNLGRTPEADQEYQARNAANLEWLKTSFALAKTNNLAGIMITIQANPGFELPREERTGFNDFLDVLTQEVIQFRKPVTLVHGDSHNFQINKPLFNATGQRLLNFTRVETFGSPDAHWVKASVNPLSRNVFTFEPSIVPANVNP